MKTNIDIPSLTQACKHIYRYSQQIPQAWTHPFTSTLKYCYITYCKTWKSSQIHSHKCFCCCSVTQSCLTFCGPMDRSTPGFPVLFHLPEFAHSCPLSRWCHPTVLSSVIPFSCLQSFPASGSFLWVSSSSVSASVLLMNIQDWFPLGLTGWISLQSKGVSRVFSNSTVQKASVLQCSAFFTVQLSHPYMTTGKTIALTRWTFVAKVMSLLFNTLSTLVIAFLPRSKCLF